MLTDKQLRDGFRFKILQSRIYLSDAVENAIAKYVTSFRKQEPPWVFSTQEEVFAVAAVLKKKMRLLALAPAKVDSDD